ncbi:MAG TPA: hypothetical protein VGC88_03520, partial [Terriglobales bacterium]
MSLHLRDRIPEALGIVAAAVYGIAMRILFAIPGHRLGVMSLSFIALVPFAMGFFAAFWGE